ncbi:replicative DNA helicase [Sinobacterium caligoides]|uniref:Replicative DNA helicase n=2 Tax=Sinobacterium caligoides TaxID=933926 RepID=A0A3N2DQS3_9GAMM|nr:replicative DNA helicase [Sinobacterium caligoides]
MEDELPPLSDDLLLDDESAMVVDDGDDELLRLKVPPHSIEAEQSVIGGLMLSADNWDAVNENVGPTDFYRGDHRLIFAAMEELIKAEKPLDIITLSEHLSNRAELDEAGGLGYLGELARNTPSVANIKAYAEIVRERSTRRSLIGAANEIAEACFDPDGRAADELLEAAERNITKIGEARPKEGGPVEMNALLKNTVAKIDEMVDQGEGITGLTSGFADLDEMTSGWQDSDLVIVAARPSMGKTTFAMNLVENAILSQENCVVVFSMEMPSESLMMRSLASVGRINQTKVRTGQLDEEDWPKLSTAINKLKDKKLFIDDTAALTPTEVRSRVRRISREHGDIAMVMIDYLQLMQVSGQSEGRTAEISEISRSMKMLAKEFECPVVCLSQLNRSLEQRPNKRPINSDLRESGAIEQDADIIAFIYRDEVYNEDSPDKGIAEIIIGKQRNGPIGTCRLAFNGAHSRFDDLAPGQYTGDYGE